MTTENAKKMLLEILKQFGRPKIVTTDKGPAFREEFSRFLKDLKVDHHLSEAYLPEKNGRAECLVGIAREMLELNGGINDIGLQDLVMAINTRTSTIPGAGSAFERLLGRKPLMHLPTLPGRLTEEEKEEMAKKLSNQRQRYRTAVKNTVSHTFALGEKVLVFNP